MRAFLAERPAKASSIGARDVDSLDRGLAGEQAGAVGRIGVDGHVAEGQLERLEPLGDRVERRTGRARPLDLGPARIAPVLAEERGQLVETGDAALDIRVAALQRLGEEPFLNSLKFLTDAVCEAVRQAND